MNNESDNEDIKARYGINATYYQVACGVYAGLSSLLLDSLPEGCHYVDELLMNTGSRYGEYLLNHMAVFTIGENSESDMLLADRMEHI